MKKTYYDVIYKRDDKECRTMESYDDENDVRDFIKFILSLKNAEVKGVLKTISEEEFIPFDDF